MKKLEGYIWEVNLEWILMMSKISQKIELKQHQSPQQILQASLLQLNLANLEQRILYELETNPALEMLDPSEEIESEEIEETDKNDKDEETEFEWEELLGINDDYEFNKSWNKKEEDSEFPLVSKETLSERIMKQLQDCDVVKKDLDIAEQVLGNLDDQGYLTIEPNLISD